jgi:hypothetical protein
MNHQAEMEVLLLYIVIYQLLLREFMLIHFVNKSNNNNNNFSKHARAFSSHVFLTCVVNVTLYSNSVMYMWQELAGCFFSRKLLRNLCWGQSRTAVWETPSWTILRLMGRWLRNVDGFGRKKFMPSRVIAQVYPGLSEKKHKILNLS